MTEIKGLTIRESDASGYTTYLPVVATVMAMSQYNAAVSNARDAFSLSGIDGWWMLRPKLWAERGTPARGTKALWRLTTKPKTGEKAKPGSVYMDVIAVGVVPADYVDPAPQAEPVTSDPKEYRAPARPQMDERGASIVAQVAFKALTDLLAAGKLPFATLMEKQPEDAFPTPSILTVYGADWQIFYEAFKRGSLPAWPERDNTVADLPRDLAHEQAVHDAAAADPPEKEKDVPW